MNRLTEDDVKEMGMFELSHNQVFVRNHEAWYRDYDMEMTARDLARAMFARNGIECPADEGEFDEYMLELLQDGYETIDGMIAMLYNALWSMADVREILKKYEDLEEQGLLIKLPCKIGQDLYIVSNRVDGKGHVRRLTLTHNNLGNVLKRLDDDIFKTREEAEKALEAQHEKN